MRHFPHARRRVPDVRELIGNTIFNNLYLFGGAICIVTDDPSSIPPLDHITSNGAKLADDAVPTEEDIRVMTVREAEEEFGGSAVGLEGTTVRDPSYSYWDLL